MTRLLLECVTFLKVVMPAEKGQKYLEKKTCENVQVILISKLNPDFFILLFHFHQF